MTVDSSAATSRQSVLIVGAGIVGLAHAWAASKRGHRVTVLERDAKAIGASVRNFGMIWPIGQPPGTLHDTAMLSRQLWLELSRESGLWLKPCGSIHLAHAEDEWAVLQEFHAMSGGWGQECELLDAAAVKSRTPAANPEGLIGGLFSAMEAVVNPRTAIPHLASWLQNRGVVIHFSTPVKEVDRGRAVTASGSIFQADRIIVCGGDDCRILFPNLIRDAGIKRCKLQMLKTSAQPGAWSLGPHLAGGLTLRHYANFASCTSLAELKARIARQTPELDRFGIHVMASQNEAGEVILGDSHEYDQDIEPFDKAAIDELMLRELRRIIQLPSWQITERWHGVYLKHPTSAILEATPLPQVHVSSATGGAGITMSFGLAEQFWRKLDADSEPSRTNLDALQ